jgi:hypothetical protein
VPLWKSKPAAGLGLLLLGAAMPGCDPEDAGPSRDRDRKPEPLIVFPEALRPEDANVSAVVRRVIDSCVRGDYEEFRLLWSAKQDPLPRDAFERGWRAVRQVTVLQLQKFRRRAEDDIVYGVHARVELDESVPEPVRDVVLLLVREADQWRLAAAPKSLQERFLGSDDEQETTTTQPTTQPATTGPSR